MTKDERDQLQALADAMGITIEGDLDVAEVVAAVVDERGELQALVAASESIVAEATELQGYVDGYLGTAGEPATTGPAHAVSQAKTIMISHAVTIETQQAALAVELSDLLNRAFAPIGEALEFHLEGSEMPAGVDQTVEAITELLGELTTTTARAKYLEEALAEAGLAIDELAEASGYKPPAYVRWRQNGRISRGHVRSGTVASLERGDYAEDDLGLVAHVVIDARAYGAATRKFDARRGNASDASTANSAAEASERARRKAASRGVGPRGGAPARFGALKGTANRADTAGDVGPEKAAKARAASTTKREAKIKGRLSALRGSPKSRTS